MTDDAHWFGLCAATESNEPHEWPYLIWVMKNRQQDMMRWPNTGSGVVLQPYQFSYFNVYRDRDPRDVWEAALEDDRRIDTIQLEHAIACAEWVLYCDLDPTDGCNHYWSPRSMQPRYAAPIWAHKRTWVSFPGVDPDRFLFLRA